jgi:hypothetical protein
MVRLSETVRDRLRLICYILNAFFILFGLLTIGLGIYFLLYKADLLSITFAMPYIRVSVIIIIFCGGVILFFAFIGLCATAVLNKCLLIGYIIILVLTALLSICAIVMAIVFKNTWYIDEVRQNMRNNIQKYYGIPQNSTLQADTKFITQTWDTVQQMWYCCGVEDQSWGIYRQSQWYNNQPGDPGTKEYTAKMVPLSCCLKSQYGVYIDIQKCQNWQLGPPNVQGANFNEALLYSGCYTIGRQILSMVASGVIGLGISICVLCFVAAALKLLLLISVVRDGMLASGQPIPQSLTPYFTQMPTYPDAASYPSSSVARSADKSPYDKGTYDGAAGNRGYSYAPPPNDKGIYSVSSDRDNEYNNPYVSTA